MSIRRLRSEDLENQLNRGALWAITYGDMMSYLMIFFLLMFSLSVNRKVGTPGEDSQRKLQESLVNIQKIFGGKASSPAYERALLRKKEESMASQLKKAMDRQDVSKYATLETLDRKIHLVLADAVLFDSGLAELKPTARDLLTTVAEQLHTLPNPVVIEGHTDNVPIRHGRYGSNWELSMARAYSVLRFFEEHGIEPSRLSGIGYGEQRPAADNATPEGRAHNRRIEIDLLRTD
jgi:chemotaxis protein MotB